MHCLLSSLLQGKATLPGKGDTTVLLLPGEASGQRVRLAVLQEKGLTDASSFRVWMGKGNGWSYPMPLLDRQDGRVGILLLITLDLLATYFEGKMTCL